MPLTYPLPIASSRKPGRSAPRHLAAITHAHARFIESWANRSPCAHTSAKLPGACLPSNRLLDHDAKRATHAGGLRRPRVLQANCPRRRARHLSLRYMR